MGINAITGAMAAVDSLHLQGDLGAAADFYMKYIGKDLSGQHIGAGFSDNESGSLTFNVGKVTVRDHRLILSIDNRVPVTYSCHDVTLAVQKTIAKTPFSLEHEYATDSILIPRDSFLVTTLMDVYKRITGDINAKPEVDGGCTYARTMPNCVAFGALLPGQPNTMHEKNEGLHVRLIDTWMDSIWKPSTACKVKFAPVYDKSTNIKTASRTGVLPLVRLAVLFSSSSIFSF